MQDSAQTRRSSVQIPGLVIDTNILSQIHSAYLELRDEGNHSDISYTLEDFSGSSVRARNPDELTDRAEQLAPVLKSLTIEHRNGLSAGLRLNIRDSGTIDMEAYGSTAEFFFKAESVLEAAKKSKVDYWSPTRAIFFQFRNRIVSAIVAVLVISLAYLCFESWYYFYAKEVGVNIDQTLVPTGNSYFKQVESALKSSDVTVKIDTLLKAQLRSFSNVSVVLDRSKFILKILLFVFPFSVLALLGFVSTAKLYPRAYFALSEVPPLTKPLESSGFRQLVV